MPRILLVSNGHGEDAVACALVPHLRALGMDLQALPIVGSGDAYRRLQVPIVGPTQAMPSGGFVYGRPQALAGDLAHGLLSLTWQQIQTIRRVRDDYDMVLAVGDIVVLLFAWLCRKPYAFVGCAKSDYYLHGKPGSYLWHERLLLRHPRCQGIYPRDGVTAGNLRAAGLNASDLGNPMMDGLEPQGKPLPSPTNGPTVLILPGSRQEAHANFARLAEAARAVHRQAPDGRSPRFLAAIAPGLDLAPFASGEWRLAAEADESSGRARLDHPDGTRVHLLAGHFADAAQASDVALAMAGTASEQVVGLGKPVFSLPGPGPQFTFAFAEAQSRLLGESVHLQRDGSAAALGEAVWTLLGDSERLERIRANGRMRLGAPGAAERIAEAVARGLSVGPDIQASKAQETASRV